MFNVNGIHKLFSINIFFFNIISNKLLNTKHTFVFSKRKERKTFLCQSFIKLKIIQLFEKESKYLSANSLRVNPIYKALSRILDISNKSTFVYLQDTDRYMWKIYFRAKITFLVLGYGLFRFCKFIQKQNFRRFFFLFRLK